MRTVLLLATILGVFAATGAAAEAAKSPKRPRRPKRGPDLILRARVVQIVVSPLPRSNLNFIVRTRVLKVRKGRFTGKRFDFRVHSPTRSNLRVGKVITIEAYRVAGGYSVPFKRY